MNSIVLLLLSAIDFVSSFAGTQRGHRGFPRGAPEIRSIQIFRFLRPVKTVVVNLGQIGSQLSVNNVVSKTETTRTLQRL
jgi:hypothetical protein